MAEYIEREAVLVKLREAVQHKGMGAAIAGILIRYIEKIPAVDVVPVVRCKNCKHCSDVMEYYADHKENKAHSKPGKACFIGLPRVVYPDDFCSRGERKDGKGND